VTLTTSNTHPKEAESVKITAKLTSALNEKSHKIQWYLNSEKVDKALRFIFSSPNDLETTFEIKPLKSQDEGALIQLAVIKTKDNTEVKKSGIQLLRSLRFLTDLKATKTKYESDEPTELSCELSVLPSGLKLLRNVKTPQSVLEVVKFEDKDTQKIDQDEYTVHVNKSKDGKSFKLRVINNKPDPKLDSDKFWLELNSAELCSNECKIEIKPGKLLFVGDISTPNASPVDNRDKIEIVFSVSRGNVAVEDIKTDLQAVLKRVGSTKEDTYLSSTFELSIIEATTTTTSTTFKLSMKELASENNSGSYYLKLKSCGERSANEVVINVENSNFFLSQLPESLEIMEGEALKLSCKCTKIVSSFEWLKDDVNLNVKDEKYKKDKLVYGFEVKSAKLSDSGVYEFRCAEGSGRDSCKCVVTVKAKPEKIMSGFKNTE